MKRTILALLLSGSLGAANASEWQSESKKDDLTGRPVPMFSVAGRPPLHQFGRTVSVKLVLACTDLYHGNKQYQDQEFYSAFLWFSEPVGLAEVDLRYTLDRGEPIAWTTRPESRGQSIHMTTIRDQDPFMVPFSKASEIRISLDLPWAGRQVVTFNTAGAAEALKKIPCHDNRF